VRRRLDLAVAAACVVAAVVLFFLFRELRHDDAFITFRYARNLIEGRGLVFNPGERILGTTSPLFTLVCAALYALFGAALPSAAVGWNALALAAQAFLLYLLVRRELPLTALALAAFTLAGAFSPFVYLGLETHTFAALVLAAVWAAQRDRPATAGLLAGLAFLTRHDAALLVPILLLRYRRKAENRRGFRFLLAAAAPVVPWLVFATVYYGWPLPRTLNAKQGVSTSLHYVQHYAELFFVLPGLPPSPWVHAVAGLLAVAGAVLVLRRLSTLRPLLGFALSLFVLYALIGPPVAQHWHMYPATLASRLLVLLGALGWLEDGLKVAAAGSERWRRLALAALAVAGLVPAVAGTVQTSRHVADTYHLGVRHSRYELAAQWMLHHAGRGRSLFAFEVGTLGYLTDYRMVDPYGLVTEEQGSPEDPRFVVRLLFDHRPDLALVHSPQQARFFEEYTPYRTVQVFPWELGWSTIMIRDPSVLLRPQELPELRQRVIRHSSQQGQDLEWPPLGYR